MSYHASELLIAGKSSQKKRQLTSLDYTSMAKGTICFNPSEVELCELVDKARVSIGRMTNNATILRIYRNNPDTIVALARAPKAGNSRAIAKGFLAHLPLNKEGHLALLDGRLDTCDPQDHYLARQNERPAAIYYWAVFCPRSLSGSLALALERMTSARNQGLPIYCKAATPEGRTLFLNLGFSDGAYRADGSKSPEPLMQFKPSESISLRRPFDTYIPKVNAGTRVRSVTVVHSLDDLLKVLAVRAAAYIEGESIPYDEDVDGNDFSATHLLGFVGDEPAGCLRIRYFSNFVKFERLAVLSRFRGKLAFDLIRAGIAFAQTKGYSRIYGHAAENVVKIWQYFGGVQRPGDGILYLTNTKYYEIDIDISSECEHVTPYSGANILLRPEGQWDRPGVLESGPRNTFRAPSLST